jgi:aconitase A
MKKHPEEIKDIVSSKIVDVFGNYITTDHISSTGTLKPEIPPNQFLKGQGGQDH